MAFMKELIEAGAYRPVIDRTYPMERVAEAHRYVETWHKTGNVVLTLSSGTPTASTRPLPAARARSTRTATRSASRVLRRCLRRLGATATRPAAPASRRGPSCGFSRRQRRRRSSQYIAAPWPGAGLPSADDRPSAAGTWSSAQRSDQVPQPRHGPVCANNT
ncbi:MAG TPA: zinc-binding dehydrogenase [Thermoleophilia bacterium]|nr:zinc-binding dehydrogenase [Thermoleophilia bacterium]